MGNVDTVLAVVKSRERQEEIKRLKEPLPITKQDDKRSRSAARRIYRNKYNSMADFGDADVEI